MLEDALPGAGYAGVVRHGRFDRIVVFHAGRHPELRGRSVADIAAERGADGFDTFLDLIVEEDDDIVGLFDYIEEKNIRALLQSPAGHDLVRRARHAAAGRARRPVAVLAVQLRGVPGRARALRARRAGAAPRGGHPQDDLLPGAALPPASTAASLRPGLKADLVVFDLDRVHDRATNLYPHAFPFENIPHAAPEGIDWVLVNGVPVLEEGAHTGELPGRVLRRR